jgi:hypothetical protein
LQNGGTLEHAQQVAAHQSLGTTSAVQPRQLQDARDASNLGRSRPGACGALHRWWQAAKSSAAGLSIFVYAQQANKRQMRLPRACAKLLIMLNALIRPSDLLEYSPRESSAGSAPSLFLPPMPVRSLLPMPSVGLPRDCHFYAPTFTRLRRGLLPSTAAAERKRAGEAYKLQLHPAPGRSLIRGPSPGFTIT